ncbi:hypothetical protein IAG41_15075 [Sphingomonas sp. JC676]|uniref:hypothetical protein n=1 Tax=Sphingomonas sp. JC676 TaxID=2768065 RepID=UPI0016576E08|nr:hypothetical protein [Sphingomonas sp. JC676]MBC9033716.1 hypothetical protein [Sphingomonas sp. JC676]
MTEKWLAAVFILSGLASPAWAQGPEQLEQLEPGKGEWQVEYFGLFGGGGDEREHSLQVMAGVTDRLALGAELESSWAAGSLMMEGIAPTALYKFSDPDAPVGVGLEIQFGLDRYAFLTGAEARLIVEKRARAWWGQADLILRSARDDGASATSIAYGWALDRAVTDRLWLGLEGSGQTVRLGGRAALAPAGEHFLGPALTYQLGLSAKGDAEIGIAYLRRVAGAGPTGTARFFVQLGF